MSRMTDEERARRENVEQYGPTAVDLEAHRLRVFVEAIMEPPVRIAAATLRIMARIVIERRKRAR